MIKKISKIKRLIIIGIAAFLFLFINLSESYKYHKGKYQLTIWSDAEGYYQYLPSFFIKNDITHQPYAFALESGKTMNKYTCGVALMEMPFFFIAHTYAKVTGGESTGYSSVYGLFIAIAASFYAFAGLWLLYLFLKKLFDRTSALITAIILFFATNLYYYTVGESGMAHVYSFFLIAWFIYILPSFLEKPGIKNSLVIGFTFAVAVLIRPTNIIIGLFFILYGIQSFSDVRARITYFIKNYRFVLLMLLLFFLVFIPQMLYWKAVTGDYFVYSYKYSFTKNESFIYWKAPRITNVLIGIRSGWLAYSPIMIVGLIGLVLAAIKKQRFFWSTLSVFAIAVYVNASWWAYTFSCGFGYRSLVDFYPVIAIPLAYFIFVILKTNRSFIKATLIFFILLFSFINIRMSYLYSQEPCWDSLYWTNKNYEKVLKKVFFITTKDASVK